jgi:hypothetical protein
MQLPESNEVASFWYSQNDALSVPFDKFVKENRPHLEKLNKYGFERWSAAILETGDLIDALIWLNVRDGIPYRIETLVQHQVGISTRRTYDVSEVDENFFAVN